MRDYISQRMSLADPWMRICAGNASPTEIAVEQSASAPDANGHCRLARLFAAHGLRHAMLLPAYAGNRPGGFVIYADSADAAHAMANEQMQGRLRLLAAVMAAHYRPETDCPHSGALQGHYQVNDLLSAREREALKWLSAGLRTAQIAVRMGIEPVTVNKHIYCAIRKLNARTREHALALALRDGLLTI
jgi:DNA-binding CsgD family transcriptional regulator